MRDNLKKSFITGVFVTGPLVISVALLVWFFQKVDGLFSPVIDGILMVALPGTPHIPGTGILAGLLIILGVGLIARNVVGQKVLVALDGFIQKIPLFRYLYTPVKQLTDAFSPENTASFKEVVLVEYPKEESYALGFRTATVEREGQRLSVVFVPTNHLYLGDVLVVPEERVQRLDMPVEQAVRLLVSAGVAAPRAFRTPRRRVPGESAPPPASLAP